MSDLEKTIHYTTQAEKICGNLKKYIPEEAKLIEPFVGDGDLVSIFSKNNWEFYDIVSTKQKNVIIQDTLLKIPDYKNKWVITNPPYLAKNKAIDKRIFDLYKVDDLYKAAILSILESEGGILIIPTNFFVDERTGLVRKEFFKHFKILEVNIFTEPVFKTTTYSVCSFAFVKKEKSDLPQSFTINIKPKEERINITVYPEYDYRIAGEFYGSISKVSNIFGRLVGKESKDYITNIKLYALDTRNERIRLEFEPNHYEGKNTDRVYATLTCKDKLTEGQEKKLIQEFNLQLENFRKQYCDLSMTNYRDYNRKRISFTFCYQLLSKIYKEIYKN